MGIYYHNIDISIYIHLYQIESNRIKYIFLNGQKYCIAGYENRYRIELWHTIRLTPLLNMYL